MKADKLLSSGWIAVETFIQHYGYIAIFIGTFLEGETILILAGFAAHQGYLTLSGVVLSAFLGSLLGDQLFFYIGWLRRNAASTLPLRWQKRLEASRRLIEKNRILIILGFRFLYGLRTITPFALGISRVSRRMFLALNLVGALIWATVFGWAGYLFGHTAEMLLGDLKKYEYGLFEALLCGSLLIWVIHRMVRTGKKKNS